MSRILHPEPLTKAAFAPFGEVIETTAATQDRMNDGRFERFAQLATVDIVQPGSARVDIVRCLEASTLPYRFDTLERHPLGSQAFIPLSPFVFVVVVAHSGATVEPGAIRAFLTNGRQGINYHRGTWHMPMIALAAGQAFLVIERSGDQANCEELALPEPMILTGPPVST